MKTTQFTVAAALASLAAAAPSPTLQRRSATEKRQAGQTECSQYAGTSIGDYTIENNLWGEDQSGKSGSQCYTVGNLNGNSVSWSTTFQWTGASNEVTSYANAESNSIKNVQLSAISSMPTSWQWSYSTQDIRADVSYDMFTTATSGGTQQYEIMIWLAAIGGVQPISSSYGSDGSATPTASGLNLGGNTFDLYAGENDSTNTYVYSFVAANNAQVTDFSGDVMDFLNYLVDNDGLSDSQYLISIQAGTEAFSGSATFTTSGFSVSQN